MLDAEQMHVQFVKVSLEICQATRLDNQVACECLHILTEWTISSTLVQSGPSESSLDSCRPLFSFRLTFFFFFLTAG